MKRIEVRDIETKEPIEGARVAIFVEAVNGLTGADGVISFDEIDENSRAILRVREVDYVFFETGSLTGLDIIEMRAEDCEAVIEAFKRPSFWRRWGENIFEGGKW